MKNAMHAHKVAFFTLLSKEITRFTRIWTQTLLPPVITMTLYFLIFGHLIGPRIGLIQGMAFIDYIVPGLIVMAMITNAYGNSVSSFFGQRFQRSIEELLVSSMPLSLMLLGFVCGATLRGLLVGTLVLIVASVFTDIHIAHAWVVLLVGFFTCITFASAGMINGIFARKFDDINIVPTFILTPLSYLGGIFYSFSMIPPFWQKISLFNPIFHVVEAFRYGFLGIADIAVFPAIIITIGFALLLYGIAYGLLKAGIGIRN